MFFNHYRFISKYNYNDKYRIGGSNFLLLKKKNIYSDLKKLGTNDLFSDSQREVPGPTGSASPGKLLEPGRNAN